ncbi:MAG: DUF3794 domain-containing protein, partial [Clostridia bacterium]|nr:DUF3794 domain-containing protein [Clostridia bacterium]
HNEGFSHGFDLREPSQEATSRAKARVEFVNCRPVGPRRVQIKASLSLSAKAWVSREESFVSDCENDKIELLKKPVRACTPVNSAERPFKVNDELEVSRSKQPVASVIRTKAHAVMQDYKVISNKIIAKGELLLQTLYAGDDEASRLETVEHSIPISQIIDLDGVTEDCVCDVRFITGDVRVEPDNDSENRMLAIEADMTASAQAFREQEFYTVTDAYCTDYDMDLKSKPISFESVGNMGRYNEMVRLSLDAPNTGIASVSDCCCEPVIKSAGIDGKALVVEGNMAVSIIAADNAGSPISLERTMPFTLHEELANVEGSMRCEPELTVLSTACGLIGDDKLDLRIECILETAVYSVVNETIVVDMAVDDSKEKECVPRKTLTLYYADKGEHIWDIAKRYNTSMNAVKRENSLEDDELEERKMLLIPKMRCKMKNS